LRESEFRDFELRLRLNSDSAGVSRIDFEDGLVIYAALFTFAHGRSGLKVYDLGSAMGYSTLWLAKALCRPTKPTEQVNTRRRSTNSITNTKQW